MAGSGGFKLAGADASLKAFRACLPGSVYLPPSSTRKSDSSMRTEELGYCDMNMDGVVFHKPGSLVDIRTQAPELAMVLPVEVASRLLTLGSIPSAEWHDLVGQCAERICATQNEPLSHWVPTLKTIHVPLQAMKKLATAANIPLLSNRIYHALMENLLGDGRVGDWSDLSAFPVKRLSQLGGVGEKSIVTLVAWLVDLSLRVDLKPDGKHEPGQHQVEVVEEGSVDTDSSESPHDPDDSTALPPLTADQLLASSLLDVAKPRLELIVAWAARELPAGSFTDALAAAASEDVPLDVRESAGQLSQLWLPTVSEDEIGNLIDTLLGEVLDERLATIFEKRFLEPDALTLEQTAQLVGEVARERVRQLERRSIQKIQQGLRRDWYRAIGWRAHSLRKRLGPVFPDGAPFVAKVLSDLRLGFLTDRQFRFMLWSAGPYRLDSGLWSLEKSSVVEDVRTFLRDDPGGMGRSLEEVVDFLAGVGVPGELAEPVLAATPGVHSAQGRYFSRTPTITDRCVCILLGAGEPMESADIEAKLGTESGLRALRARLQDDERIVRTGKDSYGLREWGLQEYSGVSNAIARAIESNGGSASIQDLVETLPEQFGVAPMTVKVYIDAPMFITDGDSVRLRQEGEEYSTSDRLTRRTGTYRYGRRLVVLQEITSDLARGSGRGVGANVAQALGVQPGGNKKFHGDGFEVGVHWPETSPLGGSIGSLRAAIAASDAELGQLLRLSFDLDTSRVSVRTVDQTTLDARQPLTALRQLTGVPADSAELAIAELAKALDCEPHVVEDVLRRRGDDLAADQVQRLLGE